MTACDEDFLCTNEFDNFENCINKCNSDVLACAEKFENVLINDLLFCAIKLNNCISTGKGKCNRDEESLVFVMDDET